MVVNDAGDGMPLPVGTVMVIHGAVNTVLRELRRTERLLVDEAPPGGPMGAFLSCRRKRLEVAAADVKVATEAGDLPGIRRAATTFDAMATATWRVQLAVRESPPTRDQVLARVTDDPALP
jgi:hypothetical protein